jgi:hypothetical protein
MLKNGHIQKTVQTKNVPAVQTIIVPRADKDSKLTYPSSVLTRVHKSVSSQWQYWESQIQLIRITTKKVAALRPDKSLISAGYADKRLSYGWRSMVKLDKNC